MRRELGSGGRAAIVSWPLAFIACLHPLDARFAQGHDKGVLDPVEAPVPAEIGYRFSVRSCQRQRRTSMTAIIDIIGREILDSRGNPTVEVDVILEDGSKGRAAVPSGASTGAHEAVELRDGDKARYGGKGVRKAVDAVNGEILRRPWRHGCRGADQDRRDADRSRRHAEQRPARRQRNSRRIARRWPKLRPLRRRRRFIAMSAVRPRALLPVPMMNIVNGGVHADNPIDFQEFMIMPVGAPTFAEALRAGAEIFHTLKGATPFGEAQHQCRRRRRFRPQSEIGGGRA